MKLGLFHFQLLYQVLERIHFIYDEDELAAAVLQSISLALNAAAGTIFRLHPDGNLVPLASHGVPIERLRKTPFQKGRGVVGWVVEHGQPVKVDKPSADTRFFGSVDAITGFKTLSLIAAPIVAKGNIIGVIEFLNRNDGPFSLPDLEVVSMVGREVGIAFENAALIQELRHARVFLSALTDSLSAAILVVDKERRVLRVNPAAYRVLRLPGKEADWIGQPVTNLLSGYPDFLRVIDEVAATAKPIPRRDVRFAINGQPRTVGYSGFAVQDSNGDRLGSAVLFQDITAYVKPS